MLQNTLHICSLCDTPQVLTLASNERIPLNPTMRLVFEISHLRTATPATVSRAGSPCCPGPLPSIWICSPLAVRLGSHVGGHSAAASLSISLQGLSSFTSSNAS